MNISPRLISKQISRITPEQMLYKLQTPIFLPFYHVVSDKKLPHILNYSYRNSTEFEKELDYYLKFFKPVSLQYLFNNQNSTEKVFHLSFDDGLRESSEIIAPILLKKGIPATFFVNSGFADNKGLFHRYKASLILNKLDLEPNQEILQVLQENRLNLKDILQTDSSKLDVLDKLAAMLEINFNKFLKTKNPYLSSKQISGLKEDGFSIGAHSKTHPEFWNLSENGQLNEIKQSMNWVNENFAPTIKAFSFPFTDSGVSLNLLRELKSENICDLTFGTAGLKYDECISHFQRYPVEKPGNFEVRLKEEWVYFIIRKILRKATVKH